MSLLYNKKKSTTDTFTYQINSGGNLLIEERGTVTIRFIDGKFSECRYPMNNTLSRNGWRIMAEIAKEIERIEYELTNEEDKNESS